MFVCAVIASLLTAVEPQVEARLLNGERLSGSLTAVSLEGIALRSDSGPHRLASDTLLELTFTDQTPRSQASESRPIVVWLHDGSKLTAIQYTAAEESATVSRPNQSDIELPLDSVAAVLFDASVEEQMRQSKESDHDSDVLLLRGQSGVNVLEGVIRDVQSDQLKFDVGDVLPVPRERAAGLIYFHAPVESATAPLCAVETVRGDRWIAYGLEVTESDSLLLTALAGKTVDLPFDDVVRIDYGFARIAYLSDLEPMRFRFAPLLALDRQNPPWLERFYRPCRDRTRSGDRLRLGDKEYEKGLAVCTGVELTYRIDGEYSRLQMQAGLAPAAGAAANLVIKTDEEASFSAPLAPDESPIVVDIDVTSANRVEIVIEYGDAAISEVLLCNARFVR